MYYISYMYHMIHICEQFTKLLTIWGASTLIPVAFCRLCLHRKPRLALDVAVLAAPHLNELQEVRGPKSI